MVERSELLDSADLPDGTERSWAVSGKPAASAADYKRGWVDLNLPSDSSWVEDANAPERDPFPGGACGRPVGYQR